jgi:signal transduction histidine kinase
MAEQYVASDKRNGLEVAVTGTFPPHHEDRIRIARTATLFTRLMATILGTENESERREGFLAVETQLEMAEALIRQDQDEVRRLVLDMMQRVGITQEQIDQMAKRIMEEIRNAQEGGDARPDGDDTPPESLPPSPN